LEFGNWNLEFRNWNLEFPIWNLDSCDRALVLG
jgi:hypothetical protein